MSNPVDLDFLSLDDYFDQISSPSILPKEKFFEEDHSATTTPGGSIPEDATITLGARRNPSNSYVPINHQMNNLQAEMSQDQFINNWLSTMSVNEPNETPTTPFSPLPNSLVASLQQQHLPQSPNTTPRKKTKTFGEEDDETVTSGTVDNSRGLSVQGIDPALLLTPDELSMNPNAPEYGFNASPQVTNNWTGHISSKPPGQGPLRRRSVSAKPTNVTPMMHQSFGTLPHADGPQLDAFYVKVHLMDMGYPQHKKEPKQFCAQVVQFICQYAKIFVGGFYLNNNTPNNQGTSWLLSCSYPSSAEFNQYFHYNVGERFIMQAALEKRCFCVHSSSWENNSGLLSFLFVPIPNDMAPNGSAIAVMVLGTILKGEVDLHAHLLFLDQIRKPIAGILRMLLTVQHNLNVLQRNDLSSLETESLRTNIFERTAMALASQKLDQDQILITTTLKGLITYVSPPALKLLGYNEEDLIAKANLINLHDFLELTERSRELEQEFRPKVFPVDFPVLTYKTITSRGQDETRNWRWVRKDRTTVPVVITIRPLHDDNSVFGFVAIAKELGVPTSSQNTTQQPSPRVSSSPPSQSKSYSSPRQVQDESRSE